MHRYFSLSAHTRQRYGKRVQKIPLDGVFSCPNRDGTLSREGCVFCNPHGSGSGFADKGMTFAEQWAFWHDIHTKNHNLELFTAYLQSYSNTYGPIEKLRAALDALHGLPGLETLSLGTRPDCLDETKLDLLAEQKEALGLSSVSLELGLQTANDATLAHINRGHTADDFARATRAASERGLEVVAHAMAGLPTKNGKEGEAELLETVDFINSLPVSGVKFHNLYVCRGTTLAKLYETGKYIPMELPEYLSQLSAALMRLKPTTVIHRLNGTPLEGELLAPEWAANMRSMHNTIRTYFKEHNVWQGKNNGAESGIPKWFSPEYRGVIP